ncbi:MAG: hypothetical protein A2731_00160 [Candidatus Buchananbacteria bacterium RIFCSPHIGHO2_01_FULL_39_8]|uniref:Uncharacterized protein n=1 Tax=Candidatus Buchananbacteria bacterium RIFCSPHIGHO2_01_FULL_39_8 TaxID=1797533 RepID=A0A1G1XZM5_9BACT|nr:MAG: hypothetical protein A2731_00160 [Candidatus Buchananbacteria bacterium RIFCSPHIGHO2_01_FULL_39_8]
MIKKALTYSVVITTIIWSVGLLATPLAVGAAVSGDLIKLQCATGAGVSDPCKAVYYLGADGKRYVFPNEKTYKTWYSDFSGVQIVSSTEMSSYAIGGNVTYRPGVKLAKITTDPKVYAVAGNGTLRWVTTAAIAESLYGSGWSSMVEDVPDAFFVNYTVGSDVAAASDYDKASETSNASSINEDKNLGGGGVSTGTGLTVALAPDTPASGIVVGNSINNKFTKINLTASADGNITIDQFVVKRGGTIASDSPFSSIALIDAATNARIGNTKTLNAEHKAVFNKDIVVSAGTTKSIYIVGNMGATALYAGEIPSLDLYAVTLSGSAAVIGTLPIVGNYQNVNGTITIGGLSLSDGNNNPSASTQKIGTTKYIVSGFKLVANSVEHFKVSQIRFHQGGTADDDDVLNLELLADDVVIATLATPSESYALFSFASNPILVEKGKTVQFDLRLNIEGGSARTIRFDIEDESDVVALGQTYGSEVKVAAGGNGATTDAEPFWTAQSTEISRGTLKVAPATLLSANIADDSDQVVLGKFELEAKGEAIEITTFPVQFVINTSSNSTVGNVTHADLTNVSIYDEAGKIVAGPTDSAHNTWIDAATLRVGATSTDTVTVPIGVHYYTIKGDVGADFEADDQIYAYVAPNAMVAKGENTGLAVTPTPAAEQQSATMTVKSAALAVSLTGTPGASTVVAGTQNYTFANLSLDAANSGEDVKITTVKVAIHSDSSANPAETSGWSLYYDSTKLAVTNDPDSDASSKTTDNQEATSTFTLSTPLIITKGTSKTLTVKANISNSATNGAIAAGIPDATGANHVTAKGNASGATATITISKTDGTNQTITGTGNLTITQDSSTPDAGFIPANSTGVTVAVLKAIGRYEDINVEKIYITAAQVNSDGGFDQIDNLHLYNGSTLVKSVTPTSTDAANATAFFDMTNTPLVIGKDKTVTLTIKADTPVLNYELNGDGANKPSSYQGFQLKINAVGDITAKGAQSGDELVAASKTVTSANGNNMYLTRSVPTFTLSEAGGTFPASTATKDLHSFTVSADSAGDIGLYSVSYEVSTSSATATDIYLYSGGTKIATATTTGGPVTSHTDDASPEWKDILTFILTTNGEIPANTNVLAAESVILAGQSRTYTVKATVQCADGCLGSGNTGSIILKFLGDGSQVSTAPVAARTREIDGGGAGASGYEYEYSLLWTDWWRMPDLQRSSTTASNTEQWLNGYLVNDNSGNYVLPTSTGATWSKAAQ